MNSCHLHKVITFPLHFSPAPQTRLGVGVVAQHHLHFMVVLCASFLPIIIRVPETLSPSTLTTSKTSMCPFLWITGMLTHPQHGSPTLKTILSLVSHQCRLEPISNHAASHPLLPPLLSMPLPVVAHAGPQKSGVAHLLLLPPLPPLQQISSSCKLMN